MNQFKFTHRRLFVVFMGLLLAVMLTHAPSLTAGTLQQDIRSSLFKEADQALAEAKQNRADLLAPKNFEKGMEFYKEAEQDLERGKNLDDIRKKLNAAVSYFKQATEATKLAIVTFSSTIKARSDAEKANAPEFAQSLWREAEEKFKQAAIKLEEGDVNGAKRKAGEAETAFRQAELDAIKASYLKPTWDLLAQADKQGVKKTAPKTLKRAQELIQQAEKELNENRYDTDVARSLAQQAHYEAKHALFLHQSINQMKKQKESLEDLILKWEIPLQQIASSLDKVAEFDEGYEKPTKEIIASIQMMQDSLASLQRKLEERNSLIASLEGRVKELESQLGTFAQKESEMQKKLKAQEELRKKFAEIEQIFTKDEARILRERNEIIIRLVGLNFGVGKSIIEPQYFSLLTKVQNAINLFPGSKIVVEGHTDSYGSDQTNLRLSQERAEAVRQYLLANMRNLTPDMVEAIGYGETRPIANNETPEGRAKNRRIDIRIIPNLPL